jgi:hypothetical protein
LHAIACSNIFRHVGTVLSTAFSSSSIIASLRYPFHFKSIHPSLLHIILGPS